MLSNRAILLALLAPGLLACGDGNDDMLTDAGVVEDASLYDAGVRRDGGRPDAGDGTRPDAGFSDPGTIFEGIEIIGGTRIYVHFRGTLTSTMPPVLFINTGPSLGHEYLVEPMDFLLGPGGDADPDRLLVLFDLRATGRSGIGTLGSTTAPSLQKHVEDVRNVVGFVNMHVDAPKVDIVGHGYGAGVATHFAVRHPEMVSRLVLTSPYPADILQHAYYNAELSARLSTADRERVLAITREPDCRGNIPQCSIELWNINGPHFLCEENRALFDTMTFEHADFRASFFYVEEQLREQRYDWRPTLARVEAPTTIISGPCDPIPPEAAETYSTEIAGSMHFEIPNSGHFPMVETATTYRGIVRGALIYP